MKKRFVALEGDGDEMDFSEDDMSAAQDPVDQSQDEGGADETADEPVALPDTESLAITELAALRASETKAHQKAALVQTLKELDEAGEHLFVVNQAMEAYRQQCRQERTDYGVQVAIARGVGGKYGWPCFVALEGLQSLSERRQVAMEGFQDLFRRLLKVILVTIERIVTLVKDLLRRSGAQVKLLRSSLEKVHARAEYLESDKGQAFEAWLRRKLVDVTRYCKGQPEDVRRLMVEGQYFTQVKTVTHHDSLGRPLPTTAITGRELVAQANDLIAAYAHFTSEDAKGFVSALNDLPAKIQAQTVDMAALQLGNPSEGLLDGLHKVKALGNYVSEDDAYLFTSEEYLGNHYLIVEMAKRFDVDDLLSYLQLLGSWRYDILSETTDVLHCDLKRLSGVEIMELNMEFLGSLRLVEEIDQAMPEYERLVETVKKTMDKAAHERMPNVDLIADLEEARAQKEVLAVYAATSAWLRNSAAIMDKTHSYGLNLVRAWIMNVAAQFQQDAQWGLKMNTENQGAGTTGYTR